MYDNPAGLVFDNPELQWQEGYYRGYYEMQISKERILASYFGTPYLQTRNGFEVSLANFTVEHDANRLSRPVAGREVENGALRNGGLVKTSNLTFGKCNLRSVMGWDGHLG
jgi:alkaline phosphatase D